MEKFVSKTLDGVDPRFDLSQLNIGGTPRVIPRTPTKVSQISEARQIKPRKDGLARGCDFGGVCFDFETTSWSSCSVVEETGDIQLRGANVHAIAAHGADFNEGLNVAGSMALAAGKLYLTKCEVDVMSGFYIEHRFFITAAHFAPEDQAAMERGGRLVTRINSARFSKYPTDVTVRTARLLHRDEKTDIAVFILDDDQKDAPATLTMDDLFAAGDVDYKKVQGRVVFAAGYNGEDVNGEYASLASGYFNALSPTKKSTLKQLLWNNPPDFADVFRPNERSMSIGRLAESPPVQDGVWHHSASGWYGISGGMIGTLEKTRTEGNTSLFKQNGLVGKVFGLFKGGKYDEEGNELVVFTGDSLRTLENLIRKEKKK